MKARTLAALILLLLTTTAHATTWWLNLGGVSLHSQGDFNGFNPGLGLTARLSDEWAVGAGFYRNSERHVSRYAAATYTPIEVAGLRVGVLGGLVNGYALNNGHAVPLLSPLAEWRADRIAISVGFIPHVAHVNSTSVLAAQVSVRF